MQSQTKIFQIDQRRAVRKPRSGAVIYASGGDVSGLATWCDESAGGASIRLGRYLRPGRPVVLRYQSSVGDNGTEESQGRVVWCRPLGGDGCTFAAGVEFHNDRGHRRWWSN